MLDSLITSKTRVKLLLKFFINTDTQAYLRGLADEFGDSTNAIRVELNRLAKAGLLVSFPNGRTKLYQANKKHPLYPDLQSLVRKFTGIDQLIDMVLSKLGTVELAFVTGDYAKGIDSGIIDVVIVGHIDRHYLQNLEKTAERLIKRKIRSLVLNKEEYEKLKYTFNIGSSVIIWNETGKQ
ncbi:MAG TPA: ArsR family transcriptional regulator [Spirochaetota bacterium]|nr:ArsR family transcriptional regulator [Spirochaetota bacterium]